MAKRTVTKPPKRAPARTQKPTARNGGFDLIPGVTWDEHAAPWILNLLVIPAAGWLTRTYVFHSWTGRTLAVAGVLVIGFVLTLALWHEARPRGGWTQARMGLTGVYTALVIAGTIVWSLDANWIKVFAFVGVGLSVWWTAANARPMRGKGEDEHRQRDSLADELGLPSSTRVKALPGESGGARRAFGWLHRDATVDAVRDSAPLIASKLGVPATGIRVVPDPDDSGRSKMYITDRDVLAEPTVWPGPSAPGTSIGDSPLRIGVREDATDLTLIRPGQEPDRKRKRDPRPSIHVITGGMTRAGKTEGELCELADGITRTEVAFLWSDTVKPDQTMRDFAPACARVATDTAKTRVMVQAVLRAIKARARYLGMRDYRQWVPGCGLTFLIPHFEELAAVAEILGENLRKVVAEAGSVGISLSGSMQRPSSYLLETDTRAQFGGNWCYGMRNEIDAAMVLSDSTIDAGAHPEAWKNSKPGYCYLEAPHIPEQEWSMPARTFLLPGSVLRQHVAEWAPRMDDIDDVTKKAMGPLLDDLPTGTEYALTIGWTRTADGLLVPPGGRMAPARETVRLSWTETGTGDEDGRPRPGTAQRTGTGTADPFAEDDTDTEAMELEGAKMDAAREVAAEHPLDPELRPDVEAALAAGDPGTPLDADYPDGEDFELAVGTPGPALTRPQRVAAFADVLWTFIAQGIGQQLDDRDVPMGEEAGERVDPVEVSTEDLVTAWYRVPGITAGQRPAMYRILKRLEKAGQIEDLGRGQWLIHPGAAGWLRDNLGADEDTDGDDDGPAMAGML